MEFNSYVFPVPLSSYTVEDFKGELIWIPKKEEYTYRDKIKYNNYKSLIPKVSSKTNNSSNIGDKDDNNSNSTPSTSNKTVPTYKNSKSGVNSSSKYIRTHRYSSSSIIQKIPSISFSFDNKFNTNTFKDNTKSKYNSNKNSKEEYIPTLFIRAPDKGSNKIIIYFHANYEDLGNTHFLCSAISKTLKVNVLSVEYPGYGIYKSQEECSSNKILEDAEKIYKFLSDIMNVEEKNIVVMGRCIGSGPATYLATKYSPASLILISPFKSIKEAVKSIFNKLNVGWLLEKFIKERFSNVENIQKVKCPILFIHGKSDEVIPWQHSLELINKCNCVAKLVTPDNMKHNYFDLNRDILTHMRDFLPLFLDTDEEEEIIYFDDIENDSEIENEFFDVIYFPIFMYSDPTEC